MTVENRDRVQYRKSCPRLRGQGYLLVKRGFDIVFSLLALAVAAVPGLVLALAVAVDTRAFPLYVQTRVGKGGKLFGICKFRTMVRDSDNVEELLGAKQLEVWKRERKVPNDPRITRFGSLLRRTSIDEIPNFLNVLVGDMSVVGPRAITEDELHWFGHDSAVLLSVKPGITGWWQVQTRNDSTFASGVRQALELFYVQHASIGLDAKIIARTVSAVLRKTGC